MAIDPVAQLAEDLAREGRASLAWCVEHIPDGDVAAASARVWGTCEDGAQLVRLCAHLAERRATLLAVCDCARAALCFVPAAMTRPGAAIAVAERRARGEASIEQCRVAAAEAADSGHGRVLGSEGAPGDVAQAICCAAYAAAYAAEAAAVLPGPAFPELAARAVNYVAEAMAHDALAHARGSSAADVPLAPDLAAARACALAALAERVRARIDALVLLRAFNRP